MNVTEQFKNTIIEKQIIKCPKCGKTWEKKMSEVFAPGYDCLHDMGFICNKCGKRFKVDFFKYADGCRCESKEFG